MTGYRGCNEQLSKYSNYQQTVLSLLVARGPVSNSMPIGYKSAASRISTADVCVLSEDAMQLNGHDTDTTRTESDTTPTRQ